MKGFLAGHSKGKEIKGGAFSTVKEVKARLREEDSHNVVDSTLGVLFDEDGRMATFESVWESYDDLPRGVKAGYAEALVGNEDFLEAVDRWVFQGVKKAYHTSIIASAGGSGAISNTIWNYLDEGETMLIPEICWGSYKLMGDEFHIKTATYRLFNEKGEFHTGAFLDRCLEIMEREGKVFAIINDPCHNPTGYSMSKEEWREVIEGLNILSQKGPVILLNDIAYMDFSFKTLEGAREYMETFNDISENILIVQTFSLSKSFTCYGLRVGAQIGICKNKEILEEFKRANEFSCRAKWSNVSNGGMEVLPALLNEPAMVERYKGERDEFLRVIDERGRLFMKEAEAADLPVYPYKEGFFITVPLERWESDPVHELLKREDIYTIKQAQGVRIAVCSTPKRSVEGLAGRIKMVIDSVRKAQKVS